MEDEVIEDGERSEEYKAEFEKLIDGEKPSKPEPKEEAKAEPKAEAKEEPLEEDEEKNEDPAHAEKEEPSGEGEPKTEESEQEAEPKPKGDDSGLAKALKDTKAWGTSLAMKNKELEKQLEDFKAGKGSHKEVEQAREGVGEAQKALDEKIKKAAEDYPELKEVLDLVAKTSTEALSKVKDFEKMSSQESERAKARQHFEDTVEPEITKVHSDFRKVAFSKEYMDWVGNQSPAIQYAAMNSLDPRDINMTLTEFKKHKAGGSADKGKSDDAQRREGVRQNLSSLRGGGSASGKGKATRLEDVDPNDREAAFAFLAEQEAKKAKG